MSSRLRAAMFGTALVAAAAFGALQLSPSAAQSPTHDHAAMHPPTTAPAASPTLPGQDAFAAIQEIVRILEADPATDWSRTDLPALREHLIDMNDVTLRAEADQQPVEGGLEIAVTGSGRTLDAIRRLIPSHARELNELPGWRAHTEPLPNGVQLTVTSVDTKGVARIRGLGLVGLLVSGSHHQPHHLMMARGQQLH